MRLTCDHKSLLVHSLILQALQATLEVTLLLNVLHVMVNARIWFSESINTLVMFLFGVMILRFCFCARRLHLLSMYYSMHSRPFSEAALRRVLGMIRTALSTLSARDWNCDVSGLRSSSTKSSSTPTCTDRTIGGASSVGVGVASEWEMDDKTGSISRCSALGKVGTEENICLNSLLTKCFEAQGI